MLIALFINSEKPKALEIAKQIKTFLIEHKVKLVVEDAEAKKLKLPKLSSVPESKINLIISLGGDGTMLRVAHNYSHLKAAILGVNIGQIGFLADVPVDNLLSSLKDLISGHYIIEKRLMLEMKTGEKKQSSLLAANDIVLHRSANPHLIHFSVFIKNVYLNTFVADGLVVSTPSGSTAYSMSADGPILYPTLDAVLINPICPHTISVRPIILKAEEEITIQYLGPQKHSVEVWADGLDSYKLLKNNSIKIKKSKLCFKLVKLKKHDYFSTLRSKLGWVGKIS